MADRITDPTRSPATQSYRTTTAAQSTARRLRDETIAPHPPTTTIRVFAADGRTSTLHPIAHILSAKTRATLAAIEKGGLS